MNPVTAIEIKNIEEIALDEMDLLELHPKFEAAKEFLHHMLLQETPPTALVKSLYPHSHKTVSHHVHAFYANQEIAPPSKGELSIRKHNPEVVKEIKDIMAKLDDEDGQYYEWSALHKIIKMNLLDWKVPAVDVMTRYAGRHAKYILRSLAVFQEEQRKRDCKIASSVHHHRVAGIAKALGMSEDDIAVAYLHDTVEDQIGKFIDDNGFSELQRFLDHYIPKELQHEVNLLTNYHDALLNHAKKKMARDGKLFTRDNISEYIQHMNGQAPLLDRYVNNIILRLTESRIKELASDMDIYESLKSACYNHAYIPELANACRMSRNYRPARKKIADLLDNREGIDSLGLEKKLQNAKKAIVAVNEFYVLHVDDTKDESVDAIGFNRNVAELGESALRFAQYYVIRDILVPRYKQDFLVSTMVAKIQELQSIFYTDRAQLM